MEISILNAIQSIASPILDAFFSFYTGLGDHGELWFAFILLTAINKKTRRIAVVALIAIAIEFLIVDNMIKPLIMRPRPFEVYPFEIIIDNPHGSSFPSGHSASSFAVAAVFYFTKHKWRIGMLICAVLMAFSRLYLFVHFPSDVIIGSLIGVLIGWIAVKYLYNNHKFVPKTL